MSFRPWHPGWLSACAQPTSACALHIRDRQHGATCNARSEILTFVFTHALTLANATLTLSTAAAKIPHFSPRVLPSEFLDPLARRTRRRAGFPMLSRRVGVQLEENALKHALHAQTPPTQEVSFGSGLVCRHPCFLDALAAEFVSPSCLALKGRQMNATLHQTTFTNVCCLC